jgi:hypothetical protein
VISTLPVARQAPRRVLLTEARQAGQTLARSRGSPAGGWTSPYGTAGPHAKTNLLMLVPGTPETVG